MCEHDVLQECALWWLPDVTVSVVDIRPSTSALDSLYTSLPSLGPPDLGTGRKEKQKMGQRLN